jgi:undecaprenyl-diphosphatase
MDKIIPFDYLLTNLFSKIIPHNIFFDYFFSFFSLKGSSIFIWILTIVLIVVLEERKNPGISIRDKKFVLVFFGSFIFTFYIADIFLKNFFRRPRPYLLLQTIHSNLITSGICPVDFSFPSAHAATAFAAAGILTHYDKKRKLLYYIIAILISYSRIYLGCHYFFDVVIGTIIGYIISRLFLFVLGTFPFRRKS